MLLSKSPYSNHEVPFALDYKNKDKSTLRNVAGGLGTTILILGAAVGVAGVAANDMAVAGVGAGVMLGGLAALIPKMSGNGNYDVEHSYEHLNQQTNNDLFESRYNRWQ